MIKAELVAIKVSPLFTGVGIVIVMGLGLLIYMKQRNK